jgi:signal peptidase I
MMEDNLLLLGLAFWLYHKTLGPKLLQRQPRSISWQGALLHAVFCSLAGVLAGITLHGYLGGIRGTWIAGAAGAGAGALLGLITAHVLGRTQQGARRILASDWEWAKLAYSALLVASPLMCTTVQAFRIPSGSMRPTLREGDQLFAKKFIYGIRAPMTRTRTPAIKKVERGDIVIFRFPSEDRKNPHFGIDMVKRVVGLPGETLEIRDKVVFVNGKALTEPYTQFLDWRIFQGWSNSRGPEAFQSLWKRGLAGENFWPQEIRDNFGPVQVPMGHYFVMGDNRDNSDDSRFWGPLPDSRLKGQAWLVFWPPGRMQRAQ